MHYVIGCCDVLRCHGKGSICQWVTTFEREILHVYEVKVSVCIAKSGVFALINIQRVIIKFNTMFVLLFVKSLDGQMY